MSVQTQEQERDVVTGAEQTHKRRDAVVIVVLLATGTGLAFASLQEGLGSIGASGAGFFPFVAAVALILSGVVALVEVLREHSDAGSGSAVDDVESSRTSEESSGARVSPEFVRLVGVLGCAALVPLLAESVGFVTTLTVSVVGMAKIAGLRGWVRPIVTGLLFGGVVWGVFVIWLNVPLPIGQFGLG